MSARVDLLRELRSVQHTLLKFSDIANRQKNTKAAKQFDLQAVAVFKAIELLKDKP